MHKVLEFLGIKNNPFYSKELKGDWLELFVNRVNEIEEFDWFIESGRTVAICSKQGIGKSSFLSYINEIILSEKDVLSAKFNFDFEKVDGNEFMVFLRKILFELLYLFKSHRDKFPSLQKIDFEVETARLNKTVTFEENVKRNFGGKIGIDFDLNKFADLMYPALGKNDTLPKIHAGMGGDRSKENKAITQIPLHNNETIKDKIIELGNLYEAPVVFLIDELDKTGKLFQDSFEWSKEIYSLLRHCREMFETSNFIFVFSLDIVFYDKKIEANKDSDEKNIDIFGIIEKFIKLDRFNLKDFEIALKKRLDIAQPDNPKRFYDNARIKLHYAFTRGNSRKFMSWYENVLFESYKKKDRSISFDRFFDVYEKELGYSFSKNLRSFFIDMANNEYVKLHTVEKKDLQIFVDEKYINENNGFYSFVVK